MKTAFLLIPLASAGILGFSPRLVAQSGPGPLAVDIRPSPELSVPSGERGFGPQTLEEFSAELLTHNPELSALMEKIRAMEQRIPQAGALDDPRFEFGLRNFPIRNFDPNADFMSGFEFGFHQMVPWPGKLGLQKKIAQSRSHQEKEEYLEMANQLVAKFKRAFYEYRFVSEAIGIQQNSLARFRGLGSVLEARYSAGKAPLQDVLNNKVEISNLQNTLIEFQRKQKVLEARLSTLLNRPPGVELKIRETAQPLTPLQAPLSILRELALRHRPWLKKSDLRIEEAEFQTKLAKKGLLPDFDFGTVYMLRTDGHADPHDNRDMISLGFSLNLPIYAGRKQKRAVQESVHMKKMEELMKAATSQEIRYQVEELFHELQQLRSQVSLLKKQTVPQSRAAVDSSRVNYEANEVDFLNVLTSELRLLNHRLAEAQYRYEYEKRIADLEVAVGVPVKVLNEMKPEKEGASDEKI